MGDAAKDAELPGRTGSSSSLEIRRACRDKCGCLLARRLASLDEKLTDEEKALERMEDWEGSRSPVILTRSEENLFEGLAASGSTTSMVCRMLMKEIVSQKRDLRSAMTRWLELADESDGFERTIVDIRDRSARLEAISKSMLKETKDIGRDEASNRAVRKAELEKRLERMEKRRERSRGSTQQPSPRRANLPKLYGNIYGGKF